MAVSRARFALNHMVAPKLCATAFFDLAHVLGIRAVEVRNDLVGVELLDGKLSAKEVGAEAKQRGISILSINGLQRFNHWTPEREKEARDLAAACVAVGAEALVLVPVNDTGWQPSPADNEKNLRTALKGLAPILTDAGLLGFVEPLGFVECSLRSKGRAVEAIHELGLKGKFQLVHDTFHHYVAGEPQLFAADTGLVHISGVSDPAQTAATMRDPHRVLVDSKDRIDNAGQIAALNAAGFTGPLSFEPFSAEVHASADIASDLRASLTYLGAA